MAVALGHLEAQFFAYAQMRGLQAVRNGELRQALGLDVQQERKLLSRLAKRGLIARARRGLYLIPQRLPPGGRWSPGEFTALESIMADCRGTYQLSGPIAFQRYGWEDQVPNRLYAYNDRISGTRKVGAVAITFIKVGDERLGETEIFTTSDGIEVVYSSRVRALIDAVHDWSRFGSLPRAYGWISAEIAAKRVSPGELIRVAQRYANISTLRRLGRLLQQEGIEESLLRRLEKGVPPSSALIPWIPRLPKRGTVDRRWGVLANGPA